MDRPRRANRTQAGFTITELMVTSMILLVIVTVAMTLLVAGQRATSFSTRRGQTQDDVRLAMDRLTKDLRQATRFQTSFTTDPWSGRDLTFWTYTAASPDTPVQVRWWVSGTTLNRREGTAGATSAMLEAITPASGGVDLFRCDVDGSDPTAGTPVPSRIRVTLTVDLTDPGATYSTETQVQLRNLDVAAP
jgi:prepilin-type N-terminal cleavage/methylation domain-containing protein